MTNEISHLKAKAKFDTLVFATVVPSRKQINHVAVNDLYGALALVGLTDIRRIDHGVVIQPDKEGQLGFSVAVEAMAMYRNGGDVSNVFAVGKQLFAGNGVVYAHSATVRSVDCPNPAPVRFFSSMAEIEAEFAAKTLDAPKAWDGPALAWTWPAKVPESLMARARG